MLNQVEYYRDPEVRRAIWDFVRDAEYIVGYGESELWRGNEKGFYTAKTERIDRMFDHGLDILTCMQHRHETISLFDIEYYYPKYPGEAYINPERVYRLLEPIYQCVMKVYQRFRIPVMSVVSGQGYHFWTRVPFGRRHDRIVELGAIESTVAPVYRRKKVSERAGRGFSGIGRLHLFLAGEVIKEVAALRAAGQRPLPVYFSDINPPHGRDAVSFDLTTYGDPVHMRDARVPFSCYQKHKVLSDKVGRENAESIPVGILIPRSAPGSPSISLERCLELRRHFRDAAELASRTNTVLPDASIGWMRVIREYKKSPFGTFFHYFDNGPATPRRFRYKDLPPCIKHALTPDELLEPTQAQAAVRVMDRMGFHPREIAEIFHRIYRRIPFGSYNPQRRAYFWVESFAALIHAGLDRKLDLTCLKHQQRDRCVKPDCGWDLSNFK